MSLSEEDKTRMYRVHRTVMEMLNDRGYDVDDTELNLTRLEFIEKFGGADLKRENLFTSKSKLDNQSSKISVFFADDPKPGVSIIKRYLNEMTSEKVLRGIIVVQQKISPSAQKAVNEACKLLHIDVFLDAELLVNVTHHAMVPPHQVLTDEEKKTLLNKYTVKETQLPRMQMNDPVARYYGLRRGQVVKILRDSETAGTYVTYRCVM